MKRRGRPLHRGLWCWIRQGAPEPPEYDTLRPEVSTRDGLLQRSRHAHHKRAEVHVVTRVQLEHPQREAGLPNVLRHFISWGRVMQARYIEGLARSRNPQTTINQFCSTFACASLTPVENPPYLHRCERASLLEEPQLHAHLRARLSGWQRRTDHEFTIDVGK